MIDAEEFLSRHFVGVDIQQLGAEYHSVLETSLRTDADVLLIANPNPDEREFSLINRAKAVDRLAFLMRNREQAPNNTQWLTRPIA